jgi:hypothetical protein
MVSVMVEAHFSFDHAPEIIFFTTTLVEALFLASIRAFHAPLRARLLARADFGALGGRLYGC